MILLTTRIRLSQAGLPAYRISWPEFTVQTVTVPAAKEDFGSLPAAKKAATRWAPHTIGAIQQIDPMDGF